MDIDNAIIDMLYADEIHAVEDNYYYDDGLWGDYVIDSQVYYCYFETGHSYKYDKCIKTFKLSGLQVIADRDLVHDIRLYL